MRSQLDAVRSVLLHDVGADAVPCHAAICLVGAEWPLFARPMSFDGVWFAWPGRLGRMMLEPEVLDREAIARVASVLARRFPTR